MVFAVNRPARFPFRDMLRLDGHRIIPPGAESEGRESDAGQTGEPRTFLSQIDLIVVHGTD